MIYSLRQRAAGVRDAATSAGTSVRVLTAAGVIRPASPVVLARVGLTVKHSGTGPAGGFAALALRHPHRIGLVDDRGSLTFDQLHRRGNALARALVDRGVGEGDTVAVMCRTHRGFVEACLAVARVGADILLLNTAFAAPQLLDVLRTERPSAIVFDEEFEPLLAEADVDVRIVGWCDDPASAETAIDALGASYDDSDLDPPGRHARIVILTSGTTGSPKGAPRQEAGIAAAVALLSRMPLRYGWRTHIAAPLFHTWGFAHLSLAMLLGSTVVLRRSFDPETCLRAVSEEACQSLVVVPVMLQRILDLPAGTRDEHPTPALEVTAVSGSSLPADLAPAWMDAYGDNLYNVYGSTEVAYASIATPADLRAAPTSAGRPPHATVVRILDAQGREVPPGTSGRIFVGNGLLFEGYTGGETKEVVDGLMSSGDLGRFDAEGRLHVEGRDDEMVVSGGENVFPLEVEDCLARHDAVVEAAAVGVADEEYGARLRAFVVVAPTDVGRAPEELEGELKEWVRGSLARFKVPREIVFVDELPRNGTGKVLKRRLAEREVG